MLPQVATHILHHTSRAAAAVHNQTSQAIRNAWQFQQSTPSTSTTTGGGITGWGGVGSSSGWGGSSTGPGGAKYHTGSRFYSGYTGPGRSITQANQTSAQPDDNDDRNIHPVRIQPASNASRPRPRSNSLSLSAQGRIDRGEGLGVLKVVQMRARHDFAAQPVVTDAVAIELSHSAEIHERPSTSTHSVATSDIGLDVPPPTPNVSSASDVDEEKFHDLDQADLEAYRRLYAAAGTRDYDHVVSEIQQYRTQTHVNVACYNMAMHALSSCRKIGQPITLIMELYNEMLARSLLPNLRTYKILLMICCARDYECHRVITTLENRMSRRSFTVGPETINESDEQRVTRLRAENTFASALTLFQAATATRFSFLGLNVYNSLLRSCACHGNVEAAIRVFAHMERSADRLPSSTAFAHMIDVYCNVLDLEGALEVFNEFKEASKRGRIDWAWVDIVPAREWIQKVDAVHIVSGRENLSRSAQVMTWNKMLRTYFRCGEPAAALDLLETMLDTPHGESFGEGDAPLPNSVTYSSIISGFCEMGDWKSALTWFDRLLVQQSAAVNPYHPLLDAPRPDKVAWIVMLDSLARAGAIDDLNRIFTRLTEIADEDNIHIRTVDRFTVFRANVLAMRAPGVDRARSNALLDFIVKQVIIVDNSKGNMAPLTAAARHMLVETVELLVEHDQAEVALDIAEKYVANENATVRDAEGAKIVSPEQVVYHSKGLRSMAIDATRTILLGDGSRDPSHTSRSIKFALRVAALSEKACLRPQAQIAPWYIHSYTESKKRGEPFQLSEHEWVLLLDAFLAVEHPPIDPETGDTRIAAFPSPSGYSYPGLLSLLLDLKEAPDIEVWRIVTVVRNKITKALINTHGAEEASRLIAELGPKFENLSFPGWGSSTRGSGVWNGGSVSVIQAEAPEVLHIDLHHSRFVDEWYPVNPSVTPLAAFERFASAAKRGIYPSPETLGRLISGLGRLGEVEKVRILYKAAQSVLAALEDQKRWQSAGWFVVEDQMIIAFAHAGQYEAANVHRTRIIEQGGSPSADAYGALISSVKDTTDDTTTALALWDESMTREVRANTYLYNTIISKLSKARKADHALQIFGKMKSESVKPSSITFGALISACCRVGDAQSAENLFHEMTTAYNFKPRVPPYNTMIQFYTSTKPDRERVLYYYNALLAARVRPTAHTYKLLLEAYGTIQPVDLASMEDIFRRIIDSRDVEVNGAHWGALINAYGCAAKDLDRAIKIFESIPSHPSTSRSSTHLPDAIVYEALFAVFSHHRRADLIRNYLQRLRESNVHPTAYVANAALKGYAAVGDLETAREIFEELEDPPMGVAAPHNHAPHEHQNKEGFVPPHAPVFREPSTWEAMVRAELGVGERERAVQLITRMEARKYPSAVVQRVRDIMYSDGSLESITPSSSSSSTSPS